MTQDHMKPYHMTHQHLQVANTRLNDRIIDWTTAYLVQCENADRQDIVRAIQKTCL